MYWEVYFKEINHDYDYDNDYDDESMLGWKNKKLRIIYISCKKYSGLMFRLLGTDNDELQTYELLNAQLSFAQTMVTHSCHTLKYENTNVAQLLHSTPSDTMCVRSMHPMFDNLIWKITTPLFGLGLYLISRIYS